MSWRVLVEVACFMEVICVLNDWLLEREQREHVWKRAWTCWNRWSLLVTPIGLVIKQDQTLSFLEKSTM